MPLKRRLYLVELFSGTKSVSRAIKRSSIGHSFDVRVLSVDNMPKFDPDVCADINRWNFERDIDAFLSDRRHCRRPWELQDVPSGGEHQFAWRGAAGARHNP